MTITTIAPSCRRLALALAALIATATPSLAAPEPKPVAGQQVRFPQGIWAGVPQVGPDGKVRQCVLVAPRQRMSKDGPVNTRFAINISRGSGFVFVIHDDGIPSEQVLDDQAEVLLGERSFPAVGFQIAGIAFTFHPGDATAAIEALGKAKEVRLRSDGGGIDSGPIDINLPKEALNWLKACGKTFDIAIDKVSDPDAPPMPAARSRSPATLVMAATKAGPPGIEDKQKIDGWDASELRNNEGQIIVCFIRRHYYTGAEPGSRHLATFFMVSRRKGLTMTLKDSNLHLPEGSPVQATLEMGETPFTGFEAQVQGPDEIGIFPQHGVALAKALENGARALMKSPVSDNFEFPVQASVIPWLRACARRNGIAIEPVGQ
jgi:hypothetical protein